MPSAKEPISHQPVVHTLDHITPNPSATAPPHGTGTQAPDGTGTQTTALSNRLLVLMAHTSRYAFRGQARLAADAGVSRSTISRLLRGRIASPSYALVCSVTRALETHLGRRLDPREIIAPGGAYPTPSGCALAGCRGCMPDEAYNEEGDLRAEYRGLRPGDWSIARSPHEQQPHASEIEPQQPEIEPQQPEIEPQQPEIEPQQPEIEPQQPEIEPQKTKLHRINPGKESR